MYLSRRDIEKIAQGVVNEYMALPKIQISESPTRIDPFILAENLLSLKVDFRHLSLDKLTFGVTSYFATVAPIYDEENEISLYPLDGKTIVIEKDLAFDPMKGKFNFTICHETSHHILRRLYPDAYGPQIEEPVLHFYRYDKPNAITNWEEWQATTLAAAILMPEDILKKNMITVGIGESLDVLNARYRKDDFYKFCSLASLMGVSITALRIRMKQLGLLKADYYRRDYQMLEIECD